MTKSVRVRRNRNARFIAKRLTAHIRGNDPKSGARNVSIAAASSGIVLAAELERIAHLALRVAEDVLRETNWQYVAEIVNRSRNHASGYGKCGPSIAFTAANVAAFIDKIRAERAVNRSYTVTDLLSYATPRPVRLIGPPPDYVPPPCDPRRTPKPKALLRAERDYAGWE